jgi:GNAT superfamily N-acetyltransferase
MEGAMQWTHHQYVLDTDPERLPFDAIISRLREAYWASDRSPDAVRASWAASGVVFGVYRNDKLVGFARVVTDFVAHAYLADVFIDPEHRGHGLGTWMIDRVLHHPELSRVNWILHTRDAHSLYERFGFERRGERLMERRRPA